MVRDRDGKYYVNFWMGTRVPVQNLDGYPGSFLSKICSPNGHQSEPSWTIKKVKRVDKLDLNCKFVVAHPLVA